MKKSLIERARTDNYLRMALNAGRHNGWSELETLHYLVEVLLNLKDEVYQERLDRMRRFPVSPFMAEINLVLKDVL